jgi:hypothetical protein
MSSGATGALLVYRARVSQDSILKLRKLAEAWPDLAGMTRSALANLARCNTTGDKRGYPLTVRVAYLETEGLGRGALAEFAAIARRWENLPAGIQHKIYAEAYAEAVRSPRAAAREAAKEERRKAAAVWNATVYAGGRVLWHKPGRAAPLATTTLSVALADAAGVYVWIAHGRGSRRRVPLEQLEAASASAEG